MLCELHRVDVYCSSGSILLLCFTACDLLLLSIVLLLLLRCDIKQLVVVAFCAKMILRLAQRQQCVLRRLGLAGNQGLCFGNASDTNAGVNSLLWRGLKGRSNNSSVDTDEGHERTARLVITHSR